MTERERLDALATPMLAHAATPYVALSGAANVVMQLSWPKVGHGVKDSRVVGARLFDDPRRRQRTTVGFLAVAVHGTAAERAAYRHAVNGSHAQVWSLPGEEPAYHALDPELQLWVGSCIYRGFEDAHQAVYGPLGRERERFYAEGVIFGGMLQMPAALWPTDRDAFEDHWRAGLAASSVDQATRDYLLSVVRLEYLDRRVPRWLAARRVWLTTGFLPPELRMVMDLPWTPDDERRFRRFAARAASVIRWAPSRWRGFPFTGSLADVRTRLAEGRDLLAD